MPDTADTPGAADTPESPDAPAAAPRALAFRTERRPFGGGEWHAYRTLTLRFEPGEPVALAQLSWRDIGGADAVVSFAPDMSAFLGVRTAAGGTPEEWRGHAVEPAVDPEPQRFAVTTGGSDGEELALLVADGGATLTRLSWTDRAGGGGAVALRTGGLPAGGEVTGSVREVAASAEFTEAGEVAESVLHVRSDKWLAPEPGPCWLRFTMVEPVVVRYYTLTSANDFAERDPREWVLSGSVDGETWTELDTRTDEVFPDRHHLRGFDITGPARETPYRHFRLRVLRNGGADCTQLERVRFFSSGPLHESFAGHRHAPGREPEPYGGVAARPSTEPIVPASGPFRGYVEQGRRPPAVLSDPSRLTTPEDWRAFLSSYSADMLRVSADDLIDVTDDQRAASWLGFEGATEAELAALEERLGTALPPSYRAFLAASNGWTNISGFTYELLGAADVHWLHEHPDQPLEPDYVFDEDGLKGPALFISGESDAQFWLLDAGDVSPDGEWAAYIWASWFPGLSDRFRSFADLVVEERRGWESLEGSSGNPVHPEGADDLLREGNRAALRGDVQGALDAYEKAEDKGSGAASYLRVLLEAFTEPRFSHHDLRHVLHREHVAAAVGPERLRAEAVPLYLNRSRSDLNAATPADARRHWAAQLAEMLPGVPVPQGDALDDPAVADWLAGRELPEPPEFEAALAAARALAAEGDTDAAWAAIEAALPAWYPVEENRIAPVVLLVDPALREVVTPRRARSVVYTPRGAERTA
ncbi:hypothetical protein HNR12_001497 [Streptomonospora nanhaiensis]|uniref:Knr4/Smi1-like domain-containing protein n=1 Tax=Streptomonospora nanhaiensis TaxID=1323731 RepID=A0A853BJL2_9ACTN|nr:SMI1/KNR4 family protein [Streptomonospora nanhaiensis]NYI95220.1 hypothetical protein [Streptomonospora nanhaiensis]